MTTSIESFTNEHRDASSIPAAFLSELLELRNDDVNMMLASNGLLLEELVSSDDQYVREGI
jgi:hypothetical protein